MIGVVLSLLSPPKKERPLFLRSATLCGTQWTPCLLTRATSATTNEFVEGIRKVIETKQTPRSDFDVHRGFDDTSNP